MKCVGHLLKSQLSTDSIDAGKNQLKLQILSEADDGTSLAESLAAQGLYTGKVTSPTDLVMAIDSMPSNDIAQVCT